MKLETIKNKLHKHFKTSNPIEFVYIFGSQAKNTANKTSDLDIAIYLNQKLKKKNRFDIQLQIISNIEHLLEQNSIDVVILNDANALLAYRVVYEGKIIYCKNELLRIRFEAKTMSLYFDQKYYYDRHTNLTLNRIAKEGLS